MSVIKELTLKNSEQIKKIAAEYEKKKETYQKGEIYKQDMRTTRRDSAKQEAVEVKKRSRTKSAKAADKPEEKEEAEYIEVMQKLNEAAGEEAEDSTEDSAEVSTEDNTKNSAEVSTAAGDIERLMLKKECALRTIEKYKRTIKTLKEKIAELEKEKTAYKEELEAMFDIICEEEEKDYED